MFYNDYSKLKLLRSKILEKITKQQQIENSPITIRDLVIYPKIDEYSYGESKDYINNYAELEIETDVRLFDHIKSLAHFTNLCHQKWYCTETKDGHKIKSNYFNTITRLSTYEFSLYGNKPLSADNFNKLIEKIITLAQSLEDNVHLLLSSFSVINHKDEVLNITLYIQGGKNAKINLLSKETISPFDTIYENILNYSKTITKKNEKYVTSAYINGYIKENEVKENEFIFDNIVISHDSLIEIKTIGGAKALVCIDICMDHSYLHAKTLLIQQLEATLHHLPSISFLPEQVEHIFLSNSDFIETKAKITRFILHIDPRPMKFFDEDNRKRIIDQEIFSEEELSKIKTDQYQAMQIISHEGNLIVSNPPFGSDYCIKIYHERNLGKYISHIAPLVNEFNKKEIELRLDTAIQLRSLANNQEDVLNFHALNVFELAKQLIKHLSQQYSSGSWFEKMFHGEDYNLKKEAENLILNANKILTQYENNKIDFIIISKTWAEDLKLRIEKINRYDAKPFLKNMPTLINQFLKETEWENKNELQRRM